MFAPSLPILVALPAARSLLLVLLLALVLPSAADAVGGAQRREGQGGFDQRTGAPPVAPATAAARTLRAALGPQAVVRLDAVTGTPRQVARLDGFLTGPSTDSPAAIALRYVQAHADLFRLDAGDLAGLGSPTDVVSRGGTHHLRWIQRRDGVPVLGGGLRAHLTADGRLLSVQGAPLPSTAVATTTPRLDAAGALRRVRRDA
ncbi:MAG: peptidase fungalysin, partial [Conexibacter sp.]|nr:peptidase fungalysin [Conexibacter sp.]